MAFNFTDYSGKGLGCKEKRRGKIYLTIAHFDLFFISQGIYYKVNQTGWARF
jgi:hypothetical protein